MDTPEEAKQKEQKKKNKAHEPSSVFQRQRVNLLLNVFAQKFPPKAVQVNVGIRYHLYMPIFSIGKKDIRYCSIKEVDICWSKYVFREVSLYAVILQMN